MIIHTKQELLELSHSLYDAGKKIIATGGCFDIMHPGHIENFHHAKTLGDVLVVFVNSDVNPYFQTKPGRPINNEAFRLQMLDALRDIDYVFPFDEMTPAESIEILKPDIFVKGGDYTKETLPEYKVIASYGGDVALVPLLEGNSTTNIIKKIVATYGDDARYNS